MKKEISAKRVAMWLGLISVGLAAAHLGLRFLRYALGFENAVIFTLQRAFDVNKEINVPSFFSASLLFFSSILLARITFLERGRWGVLSAIFLYLSLDESLAIHERLSQPLRELLGAQGAFYYAWVIPGILFVVWLWFYCREFFSKLPADTKRLFYVAAGLYVGGAVGLEMSAGFMKYYFGNPIRIHTLLVTFEEILEMFGTTVFIYALLLYKAGFPKEAAPWTSR